MFNLENAIQNWKRQLRRSPAFEDGDIAELESHLREKVKQLEAEGMSEEEAFQEASEEIGEPESIGNELYKSRATQKAGPVPPWKQKSWIPTLLPNYFKIAIRNLWKEKEYTFINIGGLAVGLACCILIALYVRTELSHDNAYEYADRLVVIGQETPFFGQGISTPYPLANALEADVPMVKSTVHVLWPGEGEVSIDGQDYFEEDGVFHAGSNFFKMFSFQFVHGSPQNALSEPNTAVISAGLARKLFPGENPMDKVIYSKRYGEYTYKVTGVAKSRESSYFDFNAVLSFSTLDFERYVGAWGGSTFNTFALLTKNSSGEKLNQQLKALAKRQYGEKAKRTFFAHKMTDFYLSDLDNSEGFRGRWLYIYLFGSVAVFILLLACVNYINLSTARAVKRAREVGVRKTAGASRAQIIRQFIGESVSLCGASYLIGLLLAWFALPFFNSLFGMNLAFSEAGFGWFFILAAIALGVGFLAGSYPAFYLSAFQATKILKGYSKRGRSESWLRKGLVAMQFAVAAVLIIGTIVVFRQLQFTQQKDLGFEGEQVVVTSIPSDSHEAFRQEVAASPNVISATVTNGIPGRFGMTLLYPAKSVSSEAGADTSESSLSFHPAVVDYNYIETLGMELVAGRQFSEGRPSDLENSYIITETTAKAMGWTVEEAIGKSFDLGNTGKVIGVLEDFHIYSFHKPIEPVTLQLFESEKWSTGEKVIAVRLASGAIQEGLRHIEDVRAAFMDEPFVYSFLDDEFAQMYREEQRLEKVFGVFAGIAVMLACMGLFGLAAFAAQRRTKEIGIRKALGATVSDIAGLLSKDFLKLALLGFIIAMPIAWYGMNHWLQNFAYRIDIGIGIFLLAGALALFIALATVSWQSVRAATANPVDSLRSE